jgi:hypothetical protein
MTPVEQKQKEENDLMWADYSREMNRYYTNCQRVNNRILKVIRNQLGVEFENAIIECAKETEACGEFRLVKELSGDLQKEDYGSFKYIWVDQRAYGDAGDSWQGEVFVQLKNGLFLEIGYSM